MTSVTVNELTNDTVPPSEWPVASFVFNERNLNAQNRMFPRYLPLLGIVHWTVMDALPLGSFAYDANSQTGRVVPYIAHAVRYADLDSATRPIDPESDGRMAYASRIEQLHLFAEEDGIGFSTESESDFLDFACTDPSTKLASLVLLDNGNLRALWSMGKQEIGVQFHGNGSLQYLISRERGDGKIIHTADRGTFGDFSDAVEAAGLGHLLYE